MCFQCCPGTFRHKRKLHGIVGDAAHHSDIRASNAREGKQGDISVANACDQEISNEGAFNKVRHDGDIMKIAVSAFPVVAIDVELSISLAQSTHFTDRRTKTNLSSFLPSIEFFQSFQFQCADTHCQNSTSSM